METRAPALRLSIAYKLVRAGVALLTLDGLVTFVEGWALLRLRWVSFITQA